MRIIITGHKGFVGSHLFSALSGLKKHEVIGWDLPDKNLAMGCASEILNIKPDAIVHLAAMMPGSPMEKDVSMLSANGILTNEVLNAASHLDRPPVVILACTAAQYGYAHSYEQPIKESQAFQPASLYAVSKCTADLLGCYYHLAHGVPVIRMRFFGIIGPGQSADFVISGWASKIVQIENKTRPPIIRVGDLDLVRDFIHVSDAVKAIAMAVDSAVPGNAYNVCSGRGIKLKKVLGTLFELSKEKGIKIEHNPSKGAEPEQIIGDPSKFCLQTGWKPKIELKAALEGILKWWREKK